MRNNRLGLLHSFLAGTILGGAALLGSSPALALGFPDCVDNNGQYECTSASFASEPRWLPRGHQDETLNGNVDTCTKPGMGPGAFAYRGGFPDNYVQYWIAPPGSDLTGWGLLNGCSYPGQPAHSLVYRLVSSGYYCSFGASLAVNTNVSPATATCVQPISLGNQGNCPGGLMCGNPINVGAANKYQHETDYVGPGPFPLRLDRHYNSLADVASGTRLSGGAEAPISREPGGFSRYWSGNYTQRIIAMAPIPQSNGQLNTFHSIYAIRPDGRMVPYRSNALPASLNPAFKETLVRQTDSNGATTGWVLTTTDKFVEQYNAAGLLQSITDRNGKQQTLTYDAHNRLWKVTDPFGRQLVYGYRSTNAEHMYQVATVQTPLGTITYQHNAGNILNKVIYQDSTEREYVYETVAADVVLTGIIDERDIRYATWAYDSSRRPISSEHAGGVDKLTVAYNSNGSVTLTDALGNVSTATIGTLNRLKYPATFAKFSAPGASNVPAKSYTRDANGNITTLVDYNGVSTTYTYDLTRNLETSRTEAAGTPRARTIVTEWHSTFPVPSKITEPGRETFFGYDSFGNLTARFERDSATQLGGQTLWTYNEFGQLTSEDGPRTDVNDVTTYAYYPSTSPHYGLLQSITNAASQVTQFTDYNANGQLLTQIDPNGVTTTFTYDARGRLKTRSANSKTTSFDYDALGQLTKVTMPDGNWVEYVYDDARRLTKIKDKAGNRIEYTLDLMGRRTKEEIKDTTGGFASLLEWIKSSLAINSPPQAN